MGGATAYRVASQQSNLVRKVVIVEAEAWRDQPATDRLSKWLRSWPVPFPTLEAGRLWLNSQGLVGEVWCDVLTEQNGGWVTEFRLDDMLGIVAHPPQDDREIWASLTIPTLVVRGGSSPMTSATTMKAMAEMLPKGRFFEVEGAGHDLHLEKPMEWRDLLLGFLSDVN
jgi:pimeloyl-ACP methyl ester carboxylesterase